ncbi:MAG: hypothetical protein ABIK28_24430, partial [Planctomycetota bacterium]
MAKLDVASDLKAELKILQEQNRTLKSEAEEAKENLRRQLIVVERQKQDLRAKEKLLDKSMALLEKDQETTQKSQESDVVEEPRNEVIQRERTEFGSMSVSGSDLIYDLNHFLSGYADSALKIVEFEERNGVVLLKPVVRVNHFLNHGPGVLMPDSMTFKVEENRLSIRARGGVVHLSTGETQSLADPGLVLADLPLIEGDTSLTPLLVGFFGLGTSKDKEEEVATAAHKPGNPQTRTLDIINRLLQSERGKKYELKSISKIEDKHLINVKMEQLGEIDSLNQLIVADSCELWLI